MIFQDETVVPGSEWSSLPAVPETHTDYLIFADAQTKFPEPAEEGMLSDFSELLDSFSQFLDSTGAIDDVFTEVLPASAVGNPVSLQDNCILTPQPAVDPRGLQIPGAQTEFKTQSYPSTAHFFQSPINISSSTSSSSQCVFSPAVPLTLAKSQSGGPTSSNSKSQSSSSTSSGGSSKENSDSNNAAGGSTLLAKLKDLCKSSGSLSISGAKPTVAGVSNLALPPESGTPAMTKFPNVATKVQSVTVKEAQENPLVKPQPELAALTPSPQALGMNLCYAEPAPSQAAAPYPVVYHGNFTPAEERTKPSQQNPDVGVSVETGSGEGETDAEGALDPDEKQKQQRLLRNRQSALQSRQRRKQYMTELESKCRGLEAQVAHMRQIVAMTAMENGALRDEIVRLQRVLAPSQQQMGVQPCGAPYEPVSAKPGSRRSSRASSPESPSPSCKGVESAVMEGSKTAGVVGVPEIESNNGVAKKAPVAVSLGAEPAALYSDSLPMESLLPTQCQLMGVLFALLLFCLSWVTSLPVGLSLFPSPLLLGLFLGPCPAYPSLLSGVAPLAPLAPPLKAASLVEEEISKGRVAKLCLWEEDDPGAGGSPRPWGYVKSVGGTMPGRE